MTGVLPTTAEKPRFVADMFERIAWRYDLMNTLMTLGQDARWRRVVAEAVRQSFDPLSPCFARGELVEPPLRILDVGTGTGRLARAILEGNPTAAVVGVDFALEMLWRAPPRVSRAAGDGMRLPFASDRFDAVISGFLVRNLVDVSAGIAEQVRVLRPGGLLVILETTPGPRGIVRWPFRMYFRHIVPILGSLIAGDISAYTYLPESTLSFLEPVRLAQILVERGLREVRTRRLALGSVAVTFGRKTALSSSLPSTGG